MMEARVFPASTRCTVHLHHAGGCAGTTARSVAEIRSRTSESESTVKEVSVCGKVSEVGVDNSLEDGEGCIVEDGNQQCLDT